MRAEPWSLQKELKSDPHQPSKRDILDLAYNISDLRNRALFCFAYLTAGRVSEGIGRFQKRKGKEPRKWIPLKKKNFEKQIVKDRPFLVIELPNLKNRSKKNKVIPVALDNDFELAEPLIQYLETLGREDIVFNITRQRAYQILKRDTGFNPHYLRHIRLTHLTVNNQFNEQSLVMFAGWSDSRPAKHYISMRWSDLVQNL